MNFIGIIPARYASSRFPGKPLVNINGKPMIQLVYEQATKALDNVCVATDDQRIFDTVKAFGGEVIMTRAHHKSGTDRCYEAYLNCHSNADVVINIQGDEPFIQPEQINAIKNCFDDSNVQIATLAKPYTTSDSLSDLQNSNTPKIVFSEITHNALYFSRSVIPYKRDSAHNDWLKTHKYYRHIGMYAYRSDVLKAITALPQSPLEIAESLEQLRWLENGYQIKVGICETYSMGIDTPDDLKMALEHLKTL